MITSMRTILITLLLALPCYGNSQSLQSQLTTWAEKYTRYDANIKPSTVVSCDIDNENERIRIVEADGQGFRLRQDIFFRHSISSFSPRFFLF